MKFIKGRFKDLFDTLDDEEKRLNKLANRKQGPRGTSKEGYLSTANFEKMPVKHR